MLRLAGTAGGLGGGTLMRATLALLEGRRREHAVFLLHGQGEETEGTDLCGAQ